MPYPRAVAAALVVLAACRSPEEEKPARPQPSASASAATVLPSRDVLLDPEAPTPRAPDLFKARFVTSKGDFLVEVRREWAPRGVDRFYRLAKAGFFDDARFFRVIDQSLVEFGISGEPALSAKWQKATFKDDPVKESNKRGALSFAMNGAGSRATRVFVNTTDNTELDAMGFAPFGVVREGMGVVDSLYKGYGEGAPHGRGPEPAKIVDEGNAYLKKSFPQLDWIKEVRVIE
jgi:peptidyl-prolyl cis-trans isomerase A (cyclophilin A)